MEREAVLSQIGIKVRARRTSMGWTLKEIAERSGISPRFLCDLEAGKGNISVARLADVAEALDVPIGSIVTDPETWQLLKRRTHTVWLKASPENHWKRVLGQGDTRPMANRTSAMAELRSILSLRSPLYAEATQMIDTNSVRVTEAVRMIAEALTDRKNGHREAQARAKSLNA